MEQIKALDLLKKNFRNVEEKYQTFFKESEPRWPGEKQDFLQNHYRNPDNLSMKSLQFGDLKVIGLPENIVKEMELAFDAFKNGHIYQ